ncbi:MAG: type III pantothenate kinase [Candidatus Cloacimonetes bacterium]|nr:type III pantothenate kinase [Candidatus Cloacimonadota bacterium]
MHPNRAETATLVVDIGNTNITCGIYQSDQMTWFARFYSSHNRTADEYYALLKPLLIGISEQQITSIALASVVPELTRIWGHLFQKYLQAEVWDLTALSVPGLSYKVPDPSFIGADLVANAYGAWHKYRANCVILDLGTATKIQLVSADGCFEGSAIAPGIKTGADQLFEKAALLSPIELTAPPVLLGTNTKDALLSGIVQGHAFMLENYIQRIKQQHSDPRDLRVILTGGIADLVKPLVPSAEIVDKSLTLDGIHRAWTNRR